MVGLRVTVQSLSCHPLMNLVCDGPFVFPYPAFGSKGGEFLANHGELSAEEIEYSTVV